MKKLWLNLFFLGLLSFLSLLNTAQAQIVYGVGSATSNVFNGFYIVSPAGVITAPTVTFALPAGIAESVAIGVSPVDGLVYWVERTGATTRPNFGTWNPTTGTATTTGLVTGLPANIGAILRSTYCPDGRWYMAGNGSGGGAGAEIYQINPANGALIRTIVVSNLPTNGSGDIVCTSNGDLYAMALVVGGDYTLYRLPLASFPSTGDATVTMATQGTTTLPNTQAFNGLSELPNGQLIGSVALATNGIYQINPSTGAATTLTTANAINLGDLSREFPRDVSVSKSVTPTVALQGTTLTYTVVVQNAGPSVAKSVAIVDTLNASVFNIGSATWTCTVLNAGANTVVTTACASPTGSGNLTTTVDMSINGTVQYVITAPLLSNFSGTATNVANATVLPAVVDSSPGNNGNTVTSTVSPALNLAVTKTDGATSTVAGGTTVYTVTFTNSGPANGTGSVVVDVPSAGLSNCTVVSCAGTGTPTAASCPATPANLLTGGATVPNFPANTSIIFSVRCRVSATGS
jgi:uncharacterized repeat protein (TIGR01451 family)